MAPFCTSSTIASPTDIPRLRLSGRTFLVTSAVSLRGSGVGVGVGVPNMDKKEGIGKFCARANMFGTSFKIKIAASIPVISPKETFLNNLFRLFRLRSFVARSPEN